MLPPSHLGLKHVQRALGQLVEAINVADRPERVQHQQLVVLGQLSTRGADDMDGPTVSNATIKPKVSLRKAPAS